MEKRRGRKKKELSLKENYLEVKGKLEECQKEREKLEKQEDELKQRLEEIEGEISRIYIFKQLGKTVSDIVKDMDLNNGEVKQEEVKKE